MKKVLRFLAGMIGWIFLGLSLLMTAAICVVLFIPFAILLLVLFIGSVCVYWSFGFSLKDYFDVSSEED